MNSLIDKAEQFLEDRVGAKVGLSRHLKASMVIARDEFGVEDEEVLVATLLHDVLEDTDTEKEELEKLFSKRVADMVEAVSHARKPTDADYARYHEAILHIPDDAKLVKLADEVQKMRSDLKRVRYVKSLLPVKQAFLESCTASEAKRIYSQSLVDYESEVNLTTSFK